MRELKFSHHSLLILRPAEALPASGSIRRCTRASLQQRALLSSVISTRSPILRLAAFVLHLVSRRVRCYVGGIELGNVVSDAGDRRGGWLQKEDDLPPTTGWQAWLWWPLTHDYTYFKRN
ncbi:unnamed protein product [Pieris brassicae]|uniref:Uncharacterized protein n=1 Tax=Pieris brassicae TaxID=7116 RepID=A0A9P0XDA2_PIEBR|nr:unnamed protein product [Pieris brassicae]